MKKIVVGTVALIALAGCGGGSDNVSARASSTAPTSSPSATPKPTKSKNPLDNLGNRTACDKARRDIRKKQQVFQDVANQTATISDLQAAAKSLQGSFKDVASFSDGTIQQAALQLETAYGHIRVAADEVDTNLLMQGVREQTAGLTKINALCESINH